MLTAEAAAPVALATHAATAEAGVAEAVPPQIDMLALTNSHTVAMRVGAGTGVPRAGVGRGAGPALGALEQLTEVG